MQKVGGNNNFKLNNDVLLVTEQIVEEYPGATLKNSLRKSTR